MVELPVGVEVTCDLKPGTGRCTSKREDLRFMHGSWGDAPTHFIGKNHCFQMVSLLGCGNRIRMQKEHFFDAFNLRVFRQDLGDQLAGKHQANRGKQKQWLL